MRSATDARAHEHAVAGFTLVEIMIASVVLVLVLGAAGLTARQGLALYGRGIAESEANRHDVRALDRIVRELRGAGLGTLNPAPSPPLWTGTLDFEVGQGWVAGAVQWSPTLRLGFEYEPAELDNGLDDDGDGLVDEGMVVRTLDPLGPAPQRIVLVRGVSEWLEGETPNGLDDNGNGIIDESGLCLSRTLDGLRVELSVERGAGGTTTIRTQAASISLRN